MAFQTVQILPPTAERLAALKAECLTFGATVRLRKLPRNRFRLVLENGERAQVRDALVLQNVVTSYGKPATAPDFRFAWQDNQLFLAFAN